MTTGVVLFTRDLRVHDHPALAQAARTFDRVVPLFVYDRAIFGSAFASPNRVRFLLESLDDLDQSLAGGLVRRSGTLVDEVLQVAREAEAAAVWLSADATSFAHARERHLAAACREAGRELRLFPGLAVVPPMELRTAQGTPFTVFTPYYRQWRQAHWRPVEEPVAALPTLAGLASAAAPAVPGPTSEALPRGGETAGRARMEQWLANGLGSYAARHDDLSGDATSRLSPYLHFGCVSPLELATRSVLAAGEAFVRQLCWRDFYHQLTAAVPTFTRESFRHPRVWTQDAAGLRAWQEGRTGVPIVDAGMRQLAREGWMHNRARLLAGSFLTKDLGIDWRAGAAHFMELLVDGDVVNNAGNWQWVAGTGNDTRPNRIFNPTLQAKRFDPHGDYVRRYVPELAAIADGAVHEPWRLGPLPRRALDYPEPIVDHATAAARFRTRAPL